MLLLKYPWAKGKAQADLALTFISARNLFPFFFSAAAQYPFGLPSVVNLLSESASFFGFWVSILRLSPAALSTVAIAVAVAESRTCARSVVCMSFSQIFCVPFLFFYFGSGCPLNDFVPGLSTAGRQVWQTSEPCFGVRVHSERFYILSTFFGSFLRI